MPEFILVKHFEADGEHTQMKNTMATHYYKGWDQTKVKAIRDGIRNQKTIISQAF